MRTFGLLLLLTIGTITVHAQGYSQSIQSNLDKISYELDKIVYEASSLTPYKKAAIESRVQSIRRMIGSTTNAPLPEYNERVLSDADLANILSLMKQASFDGEMFKVVARSSRNTRYYMNQIHDILTNFNFSEDRDKARDLLLPRAIDPENVHLLFDIYPFPSDQKKLDDIIDRQFQQFNRLK